ncbi:MAG: hypothetical protein QGG64_12955 [Candidatus Latescibacteria bacterium]|nr:hypothetical protein [Candidatus Latescibacterota bacterium]
MDILNFGAMVMGQTQSVDVVIANAGDGVLQVNDVHSELDGVSISERVFAVALEAEHSVTINFEAQQEGLIHGVLTIVSNDGDTPEVQIPIRAAVRLADPGEAIAGPVAVDLDLADGNQAVSLRSGVTAGDVVTMQVFANGLPSVSGVGFLLMFDPNALAFVVDGFTGGNFIPGATYLATDWGGILDVGGVALSGDRGEGSGLIGHVRFEVKEGFADSTFLAVTQIGFTGSDGSLQEERVRIIARLEAGQVVVGDFDGDGAVGFADFLLFAAAFGGTDPQFDLNDDGVVGFADFLIFGQAYGASKPAILANL